MCMLRTWTAKQSFGFHHRWLWRTIPVFLLRNFDRRKLL